MLAKTIRAVVGLSASLSLLSGCAIGMKIPVKDPAPSPVAYAKKDAAPTTLAFKDDRLSGEKAMPLSGTIPMQMMYQDKPFDPVPWVATHTAKELAARGLPVSLNSDTADGTKVSIQRLHIENYRANGFSPFITFTSLRADVITPKGPQRVTAYVKRGKVPVWSFDEIIEPTFNAPLSLLTKELAAKLNQQVFGQVVADQEVEALITRIEANPTRDDAYLDVYQLGFSNNRKAVPELAKLTVHPSEYVRLAAISSLGILKAEDQFDLLASLYESRAGLWQDRAMALKAIGDLGTEQSRAYLEHEWAKYEKATDKEGLWNKEILSLYL
ncbi:HEAT repeat domain-containing protein [Niveibacterium sp. SC-1]|uniref:HEAT repeat domain-containing protein n=1 Tax=Niveibacterium sp. SC-1 TaxID=3135646 RepID=UPI003120480A